MCGWVPYWAPTFGQVELPSGTRLSGLLARPDRSSKSALENALSPLLDSGLLQGLVSLREH